MSDRKRILIISANPLFLEVIAVTLSGHSNLVAGKATPGTARGEIDTHRPDVIIVDEAIGSEGLGKLLIAARDLACAQILLINLRGNDFVVLDSHSAVIRQTKDLLDTILKDRMMNDKKGGNPGTGIAAESARARAGMYGFLAALFNQRPDVDLVRRLRTVGIDSFVTMAQGEAADTVVSQGLKDMARFIDDTDDQPEVEVEQTLGVDWTRLFRGVSPNYGPTPPYEGLYKEGHRDPIEVMQSINRIYHENGLTIGDDSPNRPDYIGLELDFLRFLSEQEAEAWEQGEEELASSYANRGKTFFIEHLGRWVWKFCDQALEHARTDFYRGFLQLTKGVMTEAGNKEKI